MTNTELADLRRCIDQLQRSVGTLRSRYGDAPAVRRLVNDVERLGIDTDDLEGTNLMPRQQHTAAQRDVVVVPDTPYDESLWDGADDEGVGGYHGRRS